MDSKSPTPETRLSDTLPDESLFSEYFLPETMNSSDFERVKEVLSNALEHNISSVNGSKVCSIGGLCYELLILSKININSPSKELTDALILFDGTKLLKE